MKAKYSNVSDIANKLNQENEIKIKTDKPTRIRNRIALFFNKHSFLTFSIVSAFPGEAVSPSNLNF